MEAKKWFKKCLFILIGMMVFITGLVYVVDPYFHYHPPLDFLTYQLYEERYINDGISRNFEFDAIVTGTSMAQNFKPSEIDELYGTNTVKLTFSGGSYQEISQNLERALERNEAVGTVIWVIDYNAIIKDKDWNSYEGFPTYLYDDNPWNDVSYIFNKEILYHGVLDNLEMTLSGEANTTMDEFSSWDRPKGLDVILTAYNREMTTAEELPAALSQEEKKMVQENIQENIVRVINKFPDTQFYLLYPPYSICYWDGLVLQGGLERQLEAEKLATEMLLECPNAKLYNFYEHYEVVCETDYYCDVVHYSGEINSMILQWMQGNEDLVTKENYMDKLQKEYEFYSNYDYDSIYE